MDRVPSGDRKSRRIQTPSAVICAVWLTSAQSPPVETYAPPPTIAPPNPQTRTSTIPAPILDIGSPGSGNLNSSGIPSCFNNDVGAFGESLEAPRNPKTPFSQFRCNGGVEPILAYWKPTGGSNALCLSRERTETREDTRIYTSRPNKWKNQRHYSSFKASALNFVMVRLSLSSPRPHYRTGVLLCSIS